jgi:hypothetical protein
MRTGVRPNRPAEEDWGDAVNSGTYDNAEHEDNVSRWTRQYHAQETARERMRHERLKAGGDESLFSVIPASEIEEPEPVSLSKGGLMLSSGVHRINGPAGDGKTRLAYWEILQRVRAGERWAIFDAEMGKERYKQAMMQLGATEHELESVDYIAVADDIIPDLVLNGRALCAFALSRECSGLLLDSMTPLLAACGVSENDPQGVRAFTDAACRPMANAGGTAILIDHTGHEAKDRGRGSSDKSAGCDVDMYLHTLRPFARGISGLVQLTITKDRSGTLPDGACIYVEAQCYETGEMDFEPESWDSTVTGDGDEAVEALGYALADLGPGRDRDYVTAGELHAKMHGQAQHKTEQVDLAVRSGRISTEKSGKERHYWFTEDEPDA